jgi:hypothetical protein
VVDSEVGSTEISMGTTKNPSFAIGGSYPPRQMPPVGHRTV